MGSPVLTWFRIRSHSKLFSVTPSLTPLPEDLVPNDGSWGHIWDLCLSRSGLPHATHLTSCLLGLYLGALRRIPLLKESALTYCSNIVSSALSQRYWFNRLGWGPWICISNAAGGEKPLWKPLPYTRDEWPCLYCMSSTSANWSQRWMADQEADQIFSSWNMKWGH